MIASARRPFTALVIAAMYAPAFGPFWVVAEPTSTTTTVSIGEVSINLSYSSEEGVLRASYSTGGKECQLTLFSTQRMGLLIEVAGAEVAFFFEVLGARENLAASRGVRGGDVYAEIEI